MLSVILSLVMVFSCFAGIITTVQAVGNSPIAGDINGDGYLSAYEQYLLAIKNGETIEIPTDSTESTEEGEEE